MDAVNGVTPGGGAPGASPAPAPSAVTNGLLVNGGESCEAEGITTPTSQGKLPS